jgi:hypothetical protein
MRTNLSLYFFLVFTLMLFSGQMNAQPFDGGVLSLENGELSARSWHISSKEDDFPLLRELNGDIVAQVGAALDYPTSFIIEDGPSDDSDWTPDVRWFHIRSVNNGNYVTVQGTTPGSNVGLEPLVESSGSAMYKQQFVLVPSPAGSGWYKLRSRLSQNGPDLVLSVSYNGNITAESPDLDPSREQKFAFNLTLPFSNPATTYFLVGIHNSDYMSDKGISLDNSPAVHVEGNDYACYWHFWEAGDGYYYIVNALTEHYLSNNDNPTAGDPLYMRDNPSEGAKWEMIRDGATFKFKNKQSGHYIATKGQTADGQPLYQSVSTGIGLKWIMSPVPDMEPDVLPGNYAHLLDGATAVNSCMIFGSQFKKAVAERAGFPADEAYFPIIYSALEAHLGNYDDATRALQNFDLNEQGHRVELAYAVRQYIIGYLAHLNPASLTPAETNAIQYFQNKIQALRNEYAGNLQAAWNEFEVSFGINNGGPVLLSDLLDNLNANNFMWPGAYESNSYQADLMEDYFSASKTFNFDNQQLGLAIGGFTETLVLPGLAAGLNIIIYNGLITYFSAGKLTLKAAILASSIVRVAAGGTAHSASVFALSSAATSAGSVVTVALLAAQILAQEIMEAVEVQRLENRVNEKILWGLQPVSMYGTMIGHEELAKIRLLQDMDFLVGAPVASGFQFNTNDNSLTSPAYTLTCQQNVPVSLGSNGQATIDPAQLNLILIGCGGEVTTSLSESTFDCSDIGLKTVTVNATNGFENQSCNATINIQDNTPPFALCFPVIVQLNAAGQATITPAQANGGSFDFCSGVNLSLSKTNFNCSDPVVSLVTLTATDAAGNSSSCGTTVLLQDPFTPTALCQDITVNMSAGGVASFSPEQINNGSYDNCGIDNLALSDSYFGCGSLGDHIVTLTVTDTKGVQATCDATVTVQDHVAPFAYCKNYTTVLTDGGYVEVSPAQINNQSNDACGISSFALSQSIFSCSDLGTNIVTLTVTDASGNTGTCHGNVIISDNIPPIVFCQNVSVDLDANGQATVPATQIVTGYGDNCSVIPFYETAYTFDCSHVGVNPITVTLSDPSNNTGSCNTLVTVRDLIQPSIECPASVVVCSGENTTWSTPAAADNCGIAPASLVSVPASVTNINTGQEPVVTTVYCSVLDMNDNQNQCSFTVTVNPRPIVSITQSLLPTFCQGAYLVLTSSSPTAISYNWSNGGMAPQTNATANGNYTVIATNAYSCTQNATYTVNGFVPSNLLSSYTLISKKDLNLKKNTVFSGGVGVTMSGKKAKLEQQTIITASGTFVKAPVIEIKSGSVVSNPISGMAGITLPPFKENMNPANNDIDVPDNGNLTLTGGNYGKIEVGKNATLTFNGPSIVYLKEIKAKDNAILLFNNTYTELILDKKFELEKNVRVNQTGTNKVIIYVEDDAKIDAGSKVRASIYAEKKIDVKKANANNHTVMTGQFMAESVDCDEYTDWAMDPNCIINPSGNTQGLQVQLAASPDLLNNAVELFCGISRTDEGGLSSIERSLDGLTFEEWTDLGENAGTYQQEVLYRSDLNPQEGPNYYRIKVTLADGSVVYSNTERVEFVAAADFTLYPNPAKETVQVILSSWQGKNCHILISNEFGQAVKEMNVEVLPESPLSLDISALAEGMYWVSIQVEGLRLVTRKLVVIK